MSDDELDLIVVGAGLRGLRAALEARRDQPDLRLAVVDALPQPGGSVRTQRSNGFVCELGAFAFSEAELEPLLGLLQLRPRLLECLPGALHGQLITPTGPVELRVDPVPVSFPTGNEELPQTCRRALGDRLRLGRDVVQIEHDRDGFVVELGGEVRHRLRARALTVALPTAAAGRLLGSFDPALADVAARITSRASAFVFFGGSASEAPEVSGYGMLPREDVESPLAEVIFCSQVFPRRTMPGNFLVRCELAAPAAHDEQAMADAEVDAEAELRRWTGLTARLSFRKLHRFGTPVVDGAMVECKTRLRSLPARVPGLQVR